MTWQKPFRGIQLNRSHPLARGLVGSWIFNGGTGGICYDLTGNRSGAIIGSSIDRVSTRFGPGIKFSGDASADRINLGSVTSSDAISGVINNEITIISRAYINAGTLTNSYPRIFDKSSGGDLLNGWGLAWNEPFGEFEFGTKIATYAFILTNVSPTKGNWFTIAVSKDYTNSARIYLDGVFVNSKALGVAFPSATTNAAIGNWNHSVDRNWNGLIDYVNIWDRALSDAEVKRLSVVPWTILEQPSPARFFSIPVAGGAVAPTSTIYGPLVGPMGGPI